MYAILNHYTRDVSSMVQALSAQGVEPIVFTDTTDYYQKRGSPDRYKGLNDNFYNILAHPTDDKWKIIMHDDISVSPSLIAKIEHILQSAPNNIITFYNPTNKSYIQANASGKHILKTYANAWFPCMAVPSSLSYEINKWGRETFKPWGTIAEDSTLKHWATQKNSPIYAVLPSLVQHDGYAKSTFKNPAKAGKYFRFSEFYNPSFDVTQVDWAEAFANPYPENSKKWDTLGIDGLTKENNG